MPLTRFEIAMSKIWANGLVIIVANCAIAVDDHNGIDRGVDDRAVQGIGEAPAMLALQARICRTQLPDPEMLSRGGSTRP